MTKDSPKSGKGIGEALAGWPLRRKMALALAVPLLLAMVFGGWRVAGDYSVWSSAGTSAQQVQVLDPAVRYLTAAETAMVAAQGGGSKGDVTDAVDDLSTAADELAATAKDADLTDMQQAHVNSLLELSQAARSEGAAGLGAGTWVSLVRQLESGVTQLVSSINTELDTPEPRLEQLSQTLSGRLSLAMQQGAVASGKTGQELFSENGVEAAAIDRMAGSIQGMGDQTAALRTANVQNAADIRDGKATNLGGRDAYIPYDEITDTLTSGVEKSLNDAAATARNSALFNALITLVALGLAILLALYITKLLLEPIGRVREGALSVARQKLPDAVARIRAGEQPQEIQPIDVHTNEEIGQVARAVDDLHRQAIHLASGEAQLRQTVNAMFVTLSRRSNSLVNQQLAQIERLEQDEEDPKRLESLFRLDHLASRMRRTADSLLILADAPSRSAGSFSLTVGESLQAATSGVQDYQRVQILSHLGTQISSAAAADVVHLLTELVDNALTFSPPSEPVKLNAALEDGGVTITIADAGLGVPDSEVSQLNADLAHGSEASPDTARRMGLFVVSRLSERHGIDATLTKNPGGGMTATVKLPATVLPELPQPTARVQSATPTPATQVKADPVDKAAAVADADQASRRKSRSEKAKERAQEKAAAKQADKPAASETRARAADLLREPEVTPDRPPLETLVARREPGANMPRTGADAFLPPETSTATGPLFGKRSAPATPATPVEPATPVAPAAPDTPAAADTPAAPEPEAQGSQPDSKAEAGPLDSLAEGAEKVAPVVPITALAARQRQQAEQAAPEVVADEKPEPVEETAEKPADDLTTGMADPLTDPLPGTVSAVESSPVESSPVESPTAESPAEEFQADESPAVEDDEDDVPVDVDDPLGLDKKPEPEPDVVEAVVVESTVQEPVAEQPVAEQPAAEQPAVEETAAEPEPAAAEPAAQEGLVQRPRDGKAPIPGLPAEASQLAPSGTDSPIFKSMRSGWLATPGEGEWHETEIDRGWERAEQVAEETPVVESTPVGLPRRQPGERLVPGSVSTPTGAKTRDPEAIKRRLQAHSAGVKRGRRATTSSTQHTEAGPA